MLPYGSRSARGARAAERVRVEAEVEVEVWAAERVRFEEAEKH